MSLYEKILGESLKTNGNKLALILNESQYTYVALNIKVIKFAKSLEEQGIHKGSKVIVSSKNPLNNALFLLTLMYTEAIPMPLFAKTGRNKVLNLLKKYDVNFVLTDYRVDELDQKRMKMKTNMEAFCYCLSIKNDAELKNTKLILFTSGTTSTPKAIMLSEDNIFSNVKAISAYLNIDNNDSILLVKELSHSSSIIGELFVGLFNGCLIHLSNNIPATAYVLGMLDKYKITVLFAVPTILKGIIEYKKTKKYDLSCLRIINFYGASMNAKDISRLVALFPNTNIIYSYGQTEASPRVTYIEKEDILRYPNSCGRAIEKVSVSVVDNSGVECAPQSIGEIVVTGPNVMLGYYRNKEKTASTVKNGKLFTGDYGYKNSEGFLYITGRKDNLVIRAGKNIYPEEIEGVLASYPDILEVLVRPLYRENSTCDLYAFVVTKEHSEIDKEEIIKYCRDRLEIYKIPKKICVVNELKKTMSGKILRDQEFNELLYIKEGVE